MSDAAVIGPPVPAMDPRTRGLLEAPVVPVLLRLAAPNVLVMLAQAATGLIEAYFVGKLGTDALAGVALVFPGLMLMQMVSAGAMGGGISSAIARALGALFSLALIAGGPWLYRTLGGSGATLDAALVYSNVVFAGAILLWLFNTLANVLRGTGNMLVPAVVTCAGALVLLPLSPALIFGWGPFPQIRRG